MVQVIVTTAIGIGDFEIFVLLKHKSICVHELWIIYQLSTAHYKKFFTDRLKIWQRALAKNHVKIKIISETLETLIRKERDRERERKKNRKRDSGRT